MSGSKRASQNKIQKVAQSKEGAPREREELLRGILNAVRDAIITIDSRGVIILANPAAERMFGYARGELIGQSIAVLMPQSERDTHSSYIARYLDNIAIEREVVSQRKDGSTFPTELTVSEIEHLGLFTSIYRDISARRRTEREVEQYRKDLRTISSELMLAEDRERQRLAQDLHDGLGQALFRARMKLDQLSTKDPAVGEIATILEDIGKLLNTMTAELSPPVLRQLGLRFALKWLARHIEERYRVTVRIADDGQDIHLAERMALLLFRSVRELLINVAKHAHTDQAVLSLRRTNNFLEIEVEDQGRGFDPASHSRMVESGQFGLFSVREGLEYLGGTFHIRSARDAGTKVTLSAPLVIGKAATIAGVR
jgi:PAS domain S-box-containing protein